MAKRKGRKRRRRRRLPRPVFMRNKLQDFQPKTRVVNMRYVEEISLNGGAGGSIDSHAFRANSIFDPNQSGAGHQPYFHDQLQALYQKYQVLGSKIKVTPVPSGTSNANPAYLAVLTHDDTAVVFSTMPDLIEAKASGLNWTVAGPGPTQTGIYTTTDSVVRSSYSRKKFWGTEGHRAASSKDTGAEFGANPSEIAYYVITAGGTSAGDAGTINLLVEINYIVSCTNPVTVTAS